MKTDIATIATTIKGRIEKLEQGKLYGWIYDAEHPDEALNIDVRVANKVIGTGIANEFRDYLKAAKMGNGQHGFAIGLDTRGLPFNQNLLLSLTLHNTNDELPLSPFTLQLSGKLIGNIDSIGENNIIEGWAVIQENLDEYATIELLLNGETIAVTEASRYREDLQKVLGKGREDHAFRVKISDEVIKKLKNQGGEISLHCPGLDISNIAKLRVRPGVPLNKFEAAVKYIAKLIDGIEWSLLDPKEAIDDSLYGFNAKNAIYDKMLVHSNSPKENSEPVISPYVAFTLARFRLGGMVGQGLLAYNKAMQWYFRDYIPARFDSGTKKNRVPLSQADIAYYNQPINQPLIRNLISQCTFHFFDIVPNWSMGMQLNDLLEYRLVVYRWAIDVAPKLGIEDCLVPEAYAENLRKVAPSRWNDEMPLNNFSEIYFNARLGSDIRSVLNANDEMGRSILYTIILLESFAQPHFNHYVPSVVHKKLFEGWQQKGLIYSMVMDAVRNFGISSNATRKAELVLQPEAFKRAMQKLGYSVEHRRFLSITPSGHRIYAAQLPVPKREPEIFDVQIIGPFAKASGLGQACRLSADTLRTAGFSVNCVDFGIDNPAPEGYSSDTQLGKLSWARINLIHLNAESIPLAFAYLPNVFTGAYNIGYFFWELDSPAACHYLALDLLDEVWVSSEYGRDIYTPHAKIPVTNVGMTIETLEELHKRECRRYAEQIANFASDETVFIAIFDSFSFVQRKNPLAVIAAFQQAFMQNESVRLLLKTQNRFSVMDPEQLKIWSEVDQFIANDRRIELINHTMKYRDLLRLKKGCDVYISMHKSEGWGFGMIEAMNLQVPVICTGYSGNMDFCNADTAWLVDYKLQPLGPNDYIFVVPGQRWAEPSIASAARCMQEAYLYPNLRTKKAQAAYEYIRKNFSLTAISERYAARVKQILESRMTKEEVDVIEEESITITEKKSVTKK